MTKKIDNAKPSGVQNLEQDDNLQLQIIIDHQKSEISQLKSQIDSLRQQLDKAKFEKEKATVTLEKVKLDALKKQLKFEKQILALEQKKLELQATIDANNKTWKDLLDDIETEPLIPVDLSKYK